MIVPSILMQPPRLSTAIHSLKLPSRFHASDADRVHAGLDVVGYDLICF